MHAELFILQVCEFLDNGDGRYRFHEPSRQLSTVPGVVVVDCELVHRHLPALLEAADVVVLQGFDWDLFPVLEQRRAAGQATVLEANDWYEDIQPWNPRAAMWQDRATREVFRHCMALVDAVQTSTAELARRWRSRRARVTVFPNQLAEVPPLAPPPERPLTVGWGGSAGHLADWYHVAPLLQRWLDAHPHVHLAVMADDAMQSFVQLPAERYRFVPPGSLADYLRFVGTLDIGLAPLLPTSYNRCRSDVKFLEYAACGVAGIYADLEPYRAAVIHGETGLLYDGEAEFLQRLDQLAGHAELRQRLRERAHAHVLRARRLEQHAGKRLEFYRGLLPQGPKGFRFPEEVLAAAVCAGNYLQLRTQEPERLLAEASRGPARLDAVRTLERVTADHPRYLAAWQQQGRLLNDLREYRQALVGLEQALPLNPRSARTLCEVGRARFASGDLEGARRILEEALQLNPYYGLGWQYLLRLLGLHRSPDGPRWAEQAHRYHPTNVLVALAGARAYPPEEAVLVLHRLLDEYAPTFTAEEVPGAALAFGQAIQEIGDAVLHTPPGLGLLHHACTLFPMSARLANLLGRALEAAGRAGDARTHYARALEVRRQATVYRQEFPQEDGPVAVWQLADHIRTTLGTTR